MPFAEKDIGAAVVHELRCPVELAERALIKEPCWQTPLSVSVFSRRPNHSLRGFVAL
jgi:hypothetical protein